MKYLISLLITLAFLPSCKKEPVPDPPIIPVDTPSVYVPIYQPGDTSLGAAYAKKLTANWKAKALCKVQSYFDTNYMGLGFMTFTKNWEQRESVVFSFIPRYGGLKIYGVKSMDSDHLEPGFVDLTYVTWTSDGDLLEDIYTIDTTATDNNLTITQIDHVNKRMACTFTATFKIVEPRINAANPKTVKFSEGRAWAVIQE